MVYNYITIIRLLYVIIKGVGISMKWDINNIDSIVQFINDQLKLDIPMKEIEEKEFNVNPRVISKRLLRLGYKKINNKYVKDGSITKVIPKCNSFDLDGGKYKDITKVISNKDKDLDIDILIELQNLIGPIKEVIKDYDKLKIENDKRDILDNFKIYKAKNVKQKLFKIDSDILNEWNKFIDKYDEFKVQDLISTALKEFINRYK